MAEGDYIYNIGGLKPIREAYFQMPTNGSVFIIFQGGWTVYMPGGQVIPVYHPLADSFSISINKRIIIR